MPPPVPPPSLLAAQEPAFSFALEFSKNETLPDFERFQFAAWGLAEAVARARTAMDRLHNVSFFVELAKVPALFPDLAQGERALPAASGQFRWSKRLVSALRPAPLALPAPGARNRVAVLDDLGRGVLADDQDALDLLLRVASIPLGVVALSCVFDDSGGLCYAFFVAGASARDLVGALPAVARGAAALGAPVFFLNAAPSAAALEPPAVRMVLAGLVEDTYAKLQAEYQRAHAALSERWLELDSATRSRHAPLYLEYSAQWRAAERLQGQARLDMAAPAVSGMLGLLAVKNLPGASGLAPETLGVCAAVLELGALLEQPTPGLAEFQLRAPGTRAAAFRRALELMAGLGATDRRVLARFALASFNVVQNTDHWQMRTDFAAYAFCDFLRIGNTFAIGRREMMQDAWRDVHQAYVEARYADAFASAQLLRSYSFRVSRATLLRAYRASGDVLPATGGEPFYKTHEHGVLEIRPGSTAPGAAGRISPSSASGWQDVGVYLS